MYLQEDVSICITESSWFLVVNHTMQSTTTVSPYILGLELFGCQTVNSVGIIIGIIVGIIVVIILVVALIYYFRCRNKGT